ncbi:hypothetical protein MT349_18975 [Rathayibacter caricis]|uniref:hypothetical protein n=1 Tax=Rathayibacter caricis TaxID=110936 RepID=UPI001FB21BB9|nr:hypothetical protein [Rathayibacter caricis]MCJ1697871.1 hypothetical protein [Rathayibacter caricis]
MSDGDGVEDEVGRAARVALTVALQLGDKFARLREDLARDALRTSEAEARSLAARFSAERDVARAQLAVVDRPDWWQRAELQQVADVLQTAQQWKDLDPVAERATQTIAREVHDRFGIDVSDLPSGTAQAEVAPSDTRPPAFTVTEYRDGTPSYPDIGKDGALQMIERSEASDRTGGEWMETVKEWAGKDPEVDRAIAEKFPQLLTDEQRAAVDGARSENVETTAEAVVVAGMMDADERRADASRDEPTDAPTDQGGSESAQQNVDQAAALELQARAYEAQAEEGGTSEQSPDQLRALADDARAQAQLYRDDPEARTAADSAAASELAAAAGDLTQSGQADAEADNRELYNRELQQMYAADHENGDVDSQIAWLEHQDSELNALADAGGTATASPEELRDQADEYHTRAQYYRYEQTQSQAAPAEQSAAHGSDGQTSALRAESDLSYDSAARRTATANAMKSHAIPQEVIDVKMRADIAQGRPASDAVAQAGRVHVPNTNHHRSAGRSQQRSEQAR